MRRRFRVTEGDEGERFLMRRKGAHCITPLIIVLVVVDATEPRYGRNTNNAPAVLRPPGRFRCWMKRSLSSGRPRPASPR